MDRNILPAVKRRDAERIFSFREFSSSAICMESSRVGARIDAPGPSLERLPNSIIGIPKAAVLPVPV
ncbi:MAG: hypothetical protein V8T87_16945 [Victivallales bacterium]